jgi:hypothetical protein
MLLVAYLRFIPYLLRFTLKHLICGKILEQRQLHNIGIMHITWELRTSDGVGRLNALISSLMLVALPELARQFGWKSVCNILRIRFTGFGSDVLVSVSGDQPQGTISLLLHRAQSSLRSDVPQPVKKLPAFHLTFTGRKLHLL